MQERQVTVEGETFVPLPPFHVLATANPIEYEGTYPLPEAQLDRFLLRVELRLPDRGPGVRRARPPARAAGRRRSSLDPVTDAAGLLAMQEAVETVRVDESVGRYCVDLAAATREHPEVLTGASPRGSLGLVLAARAFGAAARPRLRHPRGRQGRGPRGARAPDHGEAGAVDDGRSGRVVVDAVLDQVPTPGTLEPDADGSDERLAADRRRCGRATASSARSGSAWRCCSASPVLVVLVAPLLLCSALGLVNRPASTPRIRSRLDHVTLHEGQGTRVAAAGRRRRRRRVRHPASPAQAPYVAMHPPSGRSGVLLGDGARAAGARGQPAALGAADPRRGEGRADHAVGRLPLGAGAAAGHADAGAAGRRRRSTRGRRPRSRSGWSARTGRARPGDGTEFAGIRPFHAGDRLRRINWRVSLRSGVAARGRDPGEEDSGVLLVVDALADHGAPAGSTARPAAWTSPSARRPRSPSTTSAAATGSGCGCSGGGEELSATAPARRHLRRVCRDAGPAPAGGAARPRAPSGSSFRATAGTVVDGAVADARTTWSVTATAALAGRGLPVIVVDTLPRGHAPAVAAGHRPGGRRPGLADAARIDRERAARAAGRTRAARWCRGAGPAPSTTCCAGWPGGPSCRRCGAR